MRLSLRHLLGTSVALALLAPAAAHAYPQWQFSSGATRCNQCHYAPGGGGLVTNYARDAVSTELSTIEGNGAFLHGVLELPSRLALGGDLRGAFVAQDTNEVTGSRQAVFPMQADLSGRVMLGLGVSVSGILGLRGQQRANQEFVPFQNYQPIYTSRLVSREHFVMWQPSAQGAYARVGRFYAPYGLRLAEHTSYVRRDLGFNQLEESYNASGGYVTTPWELHVTAFAPDFLRHIGGREAGAAAYFEHRLFNDSAALAAQTRVAFGDGARRVIGGAVGKWYVPMLRTLFLAEGNLVHWTLDGGLGRNQFVGAGGFSLLPARGLMLTMLAERNQEDLAVRAAVWNAGTAMLNWFPYPHVELQAMGRLQFPGGATSTKTLFIQVHYFL
jgi:hypothetical protein